MRRNQACDRALKRKCNCPSQGPFKSGTVTPDNSGFFSNVHDCVRLSESGQSTDETVKYYAHGLTELTSTRPLSLPAQVERL